MSRSNVRVRLAEPEDVPALVTLAESIDLARGTFSGRPLTIDSRPQFEERFLEILANGERTIMIAINDVTDEAVGFVAVREDDLATITRTPVLHISHLIVDSKFRKRGVGRALLAAVVQLADEQGVDHVLATVGTGSRDANRYLSRLGFAPLVIRRLASTTVLRRSLGMAEAPDKLAMRRRLRAGRAPRPVRLGTANRSLTRGA